MSEARVKIFAEIAELAGQPVTSVDDDTSLLSDGGLLDSMKVVSLCIALEDLAVEFEFDFDWTSDAAMSRSRSMFKSAGALVAEFERQMKSKS